MSVTSSKTLASGEAIDEGKLLGRAIQEPLCTKVNSCIVIDSKDLFSTLSSCRLYSDRSIRRDMSQLDLNLLQKSVFFDMSTRKE